MDRARHLSPTKGVDTCRLANFQISDLARATDAIVKNPVPISITRPVTEAISCGTSSSMSVRRVCKVGVTGRATSRRLRASALQPEAGLGSCSSADQSDKLACQRLSWC